MFKYKPQAPCNLDYLPAEVLRTSRMFKDTTLERINMANVANNAEVTEATVVYVLKQIVNAVESTS